jgi:hypothetical protein
MQQLVHAEGGVTEQDLGVFEALLIVGDCEMDFLRKSIYPFQRLRSLIDLAGGILCRRILDHFVNQLGIEKALLPGRSLTGFCLQGCDALRIWLFFIESGM